MSEQPVTRRFIAGAVCPRCSLMDKIVVDLETQTRKCVSCGFSEGRPEAAASYEADLQTRVNRPAARRVETAPEAVRILEPKKTRK